MLKNLSWTYLGLANTTTSLNPLYIYAYVTPNIYTYIYIYTYIHIYIDVYIQNLTQRCPMWLPNPNKTFAYLQQHVRWSCAHFGGGWMRIWPLFFAKTTKNHPKSSPKGYLIQIYILMFMSIFDWLPLRMRLNQVDNRFPHHRIVLGW